MENVEAGVCAGCLRADRKMKYLEDVRKMTFFRQIIWEISSTGAAEDVSVCWECDALFTRFMKFKSQVQRSFKILKNVEKCNTPEMMSNYVINNLYNINYIPETSECSEKKLFEVIQTETDLNEEIKQELNSDDVDGSPDRIEDDDSEEDDDNMSLLELCKKRRDLGKKQRIKKEKTTGNIKVKSQLADIQYFKEIELSMEEVEEERRSQQLKEDYVNAMFRCEMCLVSFPNADILREHVEIKHELHASSAHKCKICECAFGSEVAYNYHANKHTRRFECRACPARFPSVRGVVKHYEFQHCARTDIGYDLINKNTKNINRNPVDYNLNGSSIKGERSSFPCDQCDKVFRWKTSLRKHIETHRIETGQKRRPYCDVCNLGFTTTSNLQKHVKTSSKHQIQLKLRKLKETLPNDTCTPEKEEAHIEEIKSSINKGRQLYPCGQCDKKFQWRGNLLRHLHSHAARAKGELVCVPCHKTFSSIATYKQHMKISRKHVSEDDFNYMCSDCGRKFSNKTRLRDHVNWEHLKNFTHKCLQCQKVFRSHTSLYLHKQVVHKNCVEHLCELCGKPFPNRTKLRSHIVALHTVETPYACTVCSARFSWHSCLSRHVRRVHQRQGKQKTDTT